MNLIGSFLAKLAWSFVEFILSMGRVLGKAEAYTEQKAKNDALQDHYDTIEAGPRDLDASLGRLRDRAKSAGDKSSPAS